MKLDCKTTILLTLINQENRKRKHQWCHWVCEVCSVNLSDQSYQLSLYWLLQSILSIVLIVSIVSIVLILAFSITVCRNWRTIQMTQQTLGLPFRLRRGEMLRLLVFTGTWKYFTRSVWDINKISLGLMANNSPQGKSLPLETVGVVIFYPGKKLITIVICHLGSGTSGGIIWRVFFWIKWWIFFLKWVVVCSVVIQFTT